MIATPLQIRMVLHYYALAEPYAVNEPRHASSDAVIWQREGLVVSGILRVDDSTGSGYAVTERGKVYVEALCAMPFPIQKWVMPEQRRLHERHDTN